jgi:hypothetical protein
MASEPPEPTIHDGMPETSLHDLGVHALPQQHGGMGVPQVVEAALEAGRLEDPAAGTAKVGWPPLRVWP